MGIGRSVFLNSPPNSSNIFQNTAKEFQSRKPHQILRIHGLIMHHSRMFLQKAMAPHSSTLAWKIPWTEEAGGRQSMGSQRVGHDWATLLSLFTFTHWRRKWQPTPVFLPRESQGWGSLVGCRLWGGTESDTTEATYQQQQQQLMTNSLNFIWSKNAFILSSFLKYIFFSSYRRVDWQFFLNTLKMFYCLLALWILFRNP